METDIKAASLAYARAIEAVQKAEAPLRQFERRLEAWKNQRTFRWGEVDLVMDEAAAGVFHSQLHRRLSQAQIALAEAEDQLLALSKA